jgi:outer membrane protein assembly factor BamB
MKHLLKIILPLGILFVVISCQKHDNQARSVSSTPVIEKQRDTVPVRHLPFEIINGTFLGNESHTSYGKNPPVKLDQLWSVQLGTGTTMIGKTEWKFSGAGWTGQPLLVREDSSLFLIQGAYDHTLRKLNARTGKVVWRYHFDDVLKATGTIWYDESADSLNRLIVMQGSRQGVDKSFWARVIPSYRAVSYYTGKELWRLNSVLTPSYSRDVDGSAIRVGDTAYLPLENGLLAIFDPQPRHAALADGILQPHLFNSVPLFAKTDAWQHRGNIVAESSPVILGGRIFVTAGSGHIYGYNIGKNVIDWDFFTGSDIDGSPVVTNDSCLIVTIEKQYIRGKGGVFKLDPSKSPKEAAVWYFPTGDKNFTDWLGGVIGSATVNDRCRRSDRDPYCAVFAAIDGNMYIVNHRKTVPNVLVRGPDSVTKYPTPELLYKNHVGPSISTPLFEEGGVVFCASYTGLYRFAFDDSMHCTDRQFANIGCIEATPAIYEHKVWVASRSGLLYCLGDKPGSAALTDSTAAPAAAPGDTQVTPTVE